MARGGKALIAVALLGAAGLFAYMGSKGKVPVISLPEQAVGQSYSPFAFWIHQESADYYHMFPAVVGANCLPQPYQTQDVGQALNHVENAAAVMDHAGCAQQ